MRNMTRIMLTYLLNKLPYLFASHGLKNKKNVVLVLPQHELYYLALHLKLSTTWYSTQLIDIFSYSVPTSLPDSLGSESSKYSRPSDSVVVYNFHTVINQERLFVFTWDGLASSEGSNPSRLKSLTNLFANAAWLEREAAEMSGITFEGKSDLRNLLLPYGDTTSPLKKSFPSVGFKEIFYDINNDMLIQAPVSLQI